MQDKEYILEFLVLEDGKEKSEIEEQINSCLGKNSRRVDFEIFDLGESHFKLRFKGKCLVIGRVNDEIRKSFIKLVPLKDELGDEIREQAFPILSRIEQVLRGFIGSCMLDYTGFDWEEHGNLELVEGQKKVPLHPLERTHFGDLIGLLNSKYTLKKVNQPLTYGDVAALCSECQTFDEFKELVAEQTKEVHLWDEVFSNFVEDKTEWEKLGGLLKRVINIRNAVMHHKPVKMSYLDELREVDALLQCITNKPKTNPSEAEQELVRKALEDLSMKMPILGLKMALRDLQIPARDVREQLGGPLVDAIEAANAFRRQYGTLDVFAQFDANPIIQDIMQRAQWEAELRKNWGVSEPLRGLIEDMDWQRRLPGSTFPNLGFPRDLMLPDDDDGNGNGNNDDGSNETDKE